MSIGSTNGDGIGERYETAKEMLEIAALKRQNALLMEQAEILKEERKDLRRRLDDEADERRKARGTY